jgi:hypothetical protein
LARTTVKLNLEKRARLAQLVLSLRKEFAELKTHKSSTVQNLIAHYDHNVGASKTPGNKLRFVD